MAVQSKNQNDPNAGPVKTPAPTKPAALTDRDFGAVTQGNRYGAIDLAGASSTSPGQKVESGMAAELRGRQVGLDDVIASGTKHRDDPSVFTGRGGKATPQVAQGMRDANQAGAGAPSGAVPTKTGFNPGTVARTPGK